MKPMREPSRRSSLLRRHHSNKYKLVRLSELLHCMESGCFLGQEILHRRSVRNDTQQHIHRPELDRKQTPARLSFQAHSAPLDYKFDSWFTTMYVTFHGSSDRLQSTGYKLFSVSFTKDSAGNYVPMASADRRNGYTEIW